jgi:hypothetical protein
VTQPRPGSRRVLLWIAIGVLALVAAVAVYWALARGGAAPTPPAVTISSAPSASSTTITDSFGPEPTTNTAATTAGAAGQVRPANGCLGGPDPYQAVLPAQLAATPDQVGAAEFALTFARWTVTYPIDPNAPTVLAQVAAPGYQQLALDGLDQYGRTLSAAGYTSAGTTPGAANQYRIQSTNQDQTSITLDLIVNRESTTANGQVDAVQGYTTLLLDLVDGRWQIHGTLPAIGSDPFAPDAGAPWIPYVGTC